MILQSKTEPNEWKWLERCTMIRLKREREIKTMSEVLMPREMKILDVKKWKHDFALVTYYNNEKMGKAID